MYQRPTSATLVGMGLLKSGAAAQQAALAGFDNPALEPIREQARGAQLAGRKTLTVRLPLPADERDATGDVVFWSAAVQQVAMYGWGLAGWSVVPEPSGPVAYALFTRA